MCSERQEKRADGDYDIIIKNFGKARLTIQRTNEAEMMIVTNL